MSSRGTEDVRLVANKRSNAVLKSARGAKGRHAGEQTEDFGPYEGHPISTNCVLMTLVLEQIPQLLNLTPTTFYK